MITEKLELLASAKDYDIEKAGIFYKVTPKNTDLRAIITKQGTVSYFLTDCYNSCSDELEIDVDALMQLKQFCEMLMKGEKK